MVDPMWRKNLINLCNVHLHSHIHLGHLVHKDESMSHDTLCKRAEFISNEFISKRAVFISPAFMDQIYGNSMVMLPENYI